MNKINGTFMSLFWHSNIRKSYASAAVLGRTLSFKSDLSLEKLYPNSRQQLYTPPPPTNKDKFSGYIPINQLEVTYSRSSGPGGQHVNCVNTKVDVRFKLSEAEWIPEKTRQKLLKALQNKITKEGYFVMKSDLTRSQQMNVADVLEKLRCLIRKHEIEAAQPTEDTLEKQRRRHEKAVRERLQVKRLRSQVKTDRQGPSNVDI
ncbi:peptidyl-tRNA hydrolase ICT1, mitochondrial [Teleopsis dalmanni]|uniref:peptidyl-tRNA hydrolase ICT1, mitochondrial n=1 Tax=Teleopsis dalmanni TaxID=139649 RepID=UPI0018CDB679|nr:peptidyl-tRNA hydrolase ICT1, mitochondrial [Teleopsis dalmanni]